MKHIKLYENELNEGKYGFVDFTIFMDVLTFSKKEFNDLYYTDKEEFSSMEKDINNAKEVAKNCKIEKTIYFDEFPQGFSIKKTKYPHVFWFFNDMEQILYAISSSHENLDKMINKETIEF